jgi:hypothetical protein
VWLHDIQDLALGSGAGKQEKLQERRRMAPTSAKFIDKIIYEGFSIIALEATTINDIECNSLLEWWTRIR